MIINGLDLGKLEQQLAPVIPSDKVLLLDGDFLVYKAAATVKRLDTAIRRFYQLVLEEMFYANVKECYTYLTPTGCFKCNRWHLPTVKPYQAQRSNRQELPLKGPLKSHLLNNPNEYAAQGVEILGDMYFEADDRIVIDSYRFKERCIVSSGDKDLRLSPFGRIEYPSGEILPPLEDYYGYLNWDASHSFPIVGRGLKFFWAQMLAGDDADNIKGIRTLNGKLCGPAAAYALINPITNEQEAAECVVRAYAAINQDVLAEAEALFLRRNESDSAYEYMMALLVTPAYRDWLTSLRDYHTQHLKYIQERSLYEQDDSEADAAPGD